jgi:hypothetical protein
MEARVSEELTHVKPAVRRREIGEMLIVEIDVHKALAPNESPRPSY